MVEILRLGIIVVQDNVFISLISTFLRQLGTSSAIDFLDNDGTGFGVCERNVECDIPVYEFYLVCQSVEYMLIGFIALISAVNALFSSVFGMSFQQILGYVFYPLAWLVGIPLSDALNAGSIMATKLVANEFVAMIELQKIAHQMTPRGLGILSIFLVSFANFASIGIVAGAIKGLNEQQGNVVSRFGLRLVYGATLVSLLSASVAGLVL